MATSQASYATGSAAVAAGADPPVEVTCEEDSSDECRAHSVPPVSPRLRSNITNITMDALPRSWTESNLQQHIEEVG